MSSLSLRESSAYNGSDRSANTLKLLIQEINTSEPVKRNWLNLFNSFRILRNVYANLATEYSGLRLLAWANLFKTLQLKPTGEAPQPLDPKLLSHDEAFSIQSLEKYACDVLEVLIIEAYDMLNENGYEDFQIAEVYGAQEEIKRDFCCMLDIQRNGYPHMEMQSAQMALTTVDELASAMDKLALEFSDPVQEISVMVEKMDLDQ